MLTLTQMQQIQVDFRAITDENLRGVEVDDAPVGPCDHVVGIANDETRRARFLWMKYQQQRLLVQAELCFSQGAERKALMERFRLLQLQEEFARESFWGSCIAAFPDQLAGQGEVGVRNGWQIVWIEPESKGKSLNLSLPPIPLEALQNLLRRIAEGQTIEDEKSPVVN